MAEAKESAGQKLWRWVKDGWTLSQIISGSGFGLLVAKASGNDWKTPLPWLWTVLAAASGFAVVLLAKLAYYRVVHFLNPPHLVVEAASGVKASIALVHHGAPTSYWADGRIVKTLDGSPNPAQQRFQCDMILKGVLRGGAVLVSDGQWATVVLGEVKTTVMGQQAGLYVRRGKYGEDVAVTDAGVSVEITIQSRPARKAGPLKKQYRVVRGGNQVELVEENA